MVESADFTDPLHRIPVYSLYGEVRRPSAAMMESFDVLLVDLQDLGCRIYTFITTLRYMLESAAEHAKEIWILDRPNPAGRPVEGTTLSEGRGTTRPLEVFGAPGLNPKDLVAKMRSLEPEWMRGCVLRECWFEPTFHKHSGKLCAGLQLHAEGPAYGHAAFRP